MTEMTPETLRLLLHEFEILRGKVLATGEVADGTDTSIGVGLLLDDGYAHASAWEADLEARDLAYEALNTATAHIEALEFVVNKDGEIAEGREARIEALEKVRQAAKKYRDSHTMAGANVEGESMYDFTARIVKERAAIDEALAALAEEEKKP